MAWLGRIAPCSLSCSLGRHAACSLRGYMPPQAPGYSTGYSLSGYSTGYITSYSTRYSTRYSLSGCNTGYSPVVWVV